MPAANSIGNTRIDHSDSPLEASAAEMPSKPISVAVSNPRPNSMPSGYICQLRRIMLKTGRNSRVRKPRLPSSRSKSSSTYAPPRRTRTKVRYTERSTIRFTMAMPNRNRLDTSVPITPPISQNPLQRMLLRAAPAQRCDTPSGARSGSRWQCRTGTGSTPACRSLPQSLKILFNVCSSAPHPHKGAIHRAEHDQVHDGNAEQEQARHQRADHSPNLSRRIDAMLQRQRSRRNCDRSHDHDRRMPQREHQSHRNRPLALLHQFARDVVDCRDVVRIHRMAQSKAVRQKRGAQQHRIAVKRGQRPDPGSQVEPCQQRVDRDYLGFGAARFVVEQGPQEGEHRVPFPREPHWRWLQAEKLPLQSNTISKN